MNDNYKYPPLMDLGFDVNLPKRDEGSEVNIAWLGKEIENLRSNVLITEDLISKYGGTMPQRRLSELKAHLLDLTQTIAEREAEYRRATTP